MTNIPTVSIQAQVFSVRVSFAHIPSILLFEVCLAELPMPKTTQRLMVR
jgi:hypothetical protein